MKKLVYFIPVIVSVILGVISWCLLPDVVAVQIGLDGQVSNTMPKIFAIIIPVAITIVGSIISVKDDQSKSKGIILSLIGLAVMVLTLVFNR